MEGEQQRDEQIKKAQMDFDGDKQSVHNGEQQLASKDQLRQQKSSAMEDVVAHSLPSLLLHPFQAEMEWSQLSHVSRPWLSL